MILIAPDKFKGTYTSAEIGEVIEQFIRTTNPDQEFLRFEMADGGEGTAQIIAKLQSLEKKTEEIMNPQWEETVGEYYSSEDNRVVALDSAAFLGLQSLTDPAHYNPMEGCSNYLGRFIKGMAKAGTKEFIIGVGGTMTVDGGAGVLQELGYLFIDGHGDDLPQPITPSDLTNIYRVIPTNRLLPMFDQMDSSYVDIEDKPDAPIKALIDVSVPLIPREDDEMSSLSFAKQKGVKAADMDRLEENLCTLGSALDNLYFFLDLEDSNNIGAGGGLAMALKTLKAELIPGAEYILDKQLEHHNVASEAVTHVYTGEGCLDEQSFHGKVTGTIVNRFAKAGIPVTIVCGRNNLPTTYPLPANVEIRLLSDIIDHLQ